MAVRNQLVINPNSKEMSPTTSADIVAWQKWAIYQYGLDPSVKVVPHATNSGSRGNIVSDLMVDYRRTAGLGLTSTGPITEDDFGNLEKYALGLEFVEFERRLTHDTSHPWSTSGPSDEYNMLRSYPVYYNSATNSIQSMTPRDFMDTFIYPALDKFFNATLSLEDLAWRAGEYYISRSLATTESYYNANLVFFGSSRRVNNISEPVFVDTVADRFAYTVDGLIEERDQPVVDYRYHLRVIDPIQPSVTPDLPLYLDSDGNLQQYTLEQFVTLLGEHYKWQAAYGDSQTVNDSGAQDPNYDGEYCIQYKVEQLNGVQTILPSLIDIEIGFIGNNPTDLNYTKKVHRGTTMINTSRNFDDYLFLSKEFSADDYRAQRVPSSATPELKQEYRMFVVNNKPS